MLEETGARRLVWLAQPMRRGVTRDEVRQAGNRPCGLVDQGQVLGFESDLMESHRRNGARLWYHLLRLRRSPSMLGREDGGSARAGTEGHSLGS